MRKKELDKIRMLEIEAIRKKLESVKNRRDRAQILTIIRENRKEEPPTRKASAS